MLILYILMPFILILIIIVILNVIKAYFFNKTTYHLITKNTYLSTRFNIGKYGEYLIYKHLRKYEEHDGKFLFNLYLPKENKETTEIDVLLISRKGIFVFESKNYSGWIFGDDKSKIWTQTLPQGKGKSKKIKFFNPVFQNNVHIKYLKSIIDKDVPIYSMITFSDRCTLKKVTISTPNAFVYNRNRVVRVINGITQNQTDVLTNDEIEKLYNVLYPYSQVSNDIKEAHNSIINNRKKDL